jgi:hypothetical protein
VMFGEDAHSMIVQLAHPWIEQEEKSCEVF